MKLQIDTNLKTIKIEEDVNLGELMDMLNSFFPNDKWKEFSLKPELITNWINPVTIPYVPYVPTYPYPWTGPIVTYEDGTGFPQITEGTYNVEVKC